MKGKLVSIASLSQRKSEQLQSANSIPPMYISIEKYFLDPQVDAIIYHLEIGVQKNQSVSVWAIDRRYSELSHLDSDIRGQFGSSQYLLDFPPKKFYGNKDPQFLELRNDQLQRYLGGLVKIPGISSFPSFIRFFGIDDGLLNDL
jgi:hypothetical protein